MRSEIETLKTWITESDNIVFFGGAGVSTESGIPDFRSTDGLYHQKFDYPPETILSHTFFYQNPAYFFRFYREKMLPLDYQPNEAHKKLAALEQAGKLRAIVTQNIDGLHQKAGSKNVFELHGSIYRNYCEKCGKFYPPEFIRDSGGIPRCTCGGRIKPDVVLYEESLDQKVIEGAVNAIADAEVLIVATEWRQFAMANLPKVRELMRLPIIFDGRNIIHGENAVSAGFEYHSVGRKSLYPTK